MSETTPDPQASGASVGTTTGSTIGTDEQRAHRADKLAHRRASGRAEPHRYPVDSTTAGVREAYAHLGAGDETTDRVTLAGRLVLARDQGGLTFGVLQDRTGELQLFVDRKRLDPADFADFRDLDRGDWIGVQGDVIRTRRGELSVRVVAFDLLGKALRPLPDKDKPFTDVETRSRQRYVDLVVNERTRRTFAVRRAVIRGLRRHLEDLGFWEVEGPVLQSIQGGALARPFIAHHNSLSLDLYLRIALELHLKRLVVGGLERVFEIGRVFRNEGIDLTHNPEFTMLEAYQAYADYHDLTDLVQGLVQAAAREALGDDLEVEVGGRRIDLGGSWPRLRFPDLLEEHTGARMDPAMPVGRARALLDERGVAHQPDWGSGRCMKELFDERVQRTLAGPVFVLDYPAEVSPLARTDPERPGYAERFELIVAGAELCNAYSEQNDPVAQLAAFEGEARAKAAGDPEAGDVDLDYVRALEHGMPCTGGLGIGVDRLVMLIAGVDAIREVLLFPTLRPEAGPGSGATGPEVGTGATTPLVGDASEDRLR